LGPSKDVDPGYAVQIVTPKRVAVRSANPDGFAANAKNAGYLIRTLEHVCSFGRIDKFYTMAAMPLIAPILIAGAPGTGGVCA
jgi:hypothetical protein